MGTAFAVGVTLLVAPSSAGAASVAGGVSPEVTQVSLKTSRQRVAPRQSFTLSARLVVASDGSPVSGEPVTLQWQRIGRAGWEQGPERVTGQAGRVSWSQRTPESRRYRVVFEGTTDYAPSASVVREVRMKPVVSASATRNWVRPDGTVKVRARVRPAFEGELVSLQSRVNGKWVTVKRKQQGGKGRVDFIVGGRSQYGLQRYRVMLEARDHHLSAKSRTLEIRTVRIVTYVIETRGKVRSAMPSFRKRTAEIYADPRGWSRANVHFKRVRSGGAFSLVLSAARYVPGFAPICDRYWSCRVGRYVIINEDRWRHGTPYFKSAGGDLRQYRAMVVNHETGHWFGLGHASCGGSGQRAPVMMQQSKGLNGCKPNPWPLPGEVARAY